jgi:diguanylate cyclase (GGDEF)-like protein
MRRLLDETGVEVRSNELRRLVRSTSAVQIFTLLLVALVVIWSKDVVTGVTPVLIMMGGFTAAIIAFRVPRFFPRETRLKLAIESWTMMAFITGVLWYTGKNASPLLNLYLLPMILSALTLGRLITLLQIGLIFVCHLLLAAANPAVDVFTASFASRAAVELAPVLLVGYLTTALSTDISEARKQLENLAQTDALTGVLNLSAFNDIWRRYHASFLPDKGVYALLMIDIDKLNSINENFGHEAGDSAIVLVSKCVQRCIRNSDHVGRVGGDKFVVLLATATPEVADVVVKRIRNNVYSTTLDVRSRMIRCNVNLGVANYPKDARDMRELIGIADKRMQRDGELRRPPGPDPSP